MPTHPDPRRPTDTARLELTRLPADTPLADVFARACEAAVAALTVARAGVWLYIDGQTALRCATVFERDTGQYSGGAVLRPADFPTYFAALAIRKSVPAEVAATDPRTAELTAAHFAPLGITSTLDAGIFVDDEMVGVVCLEHVGRPREWTTEDRDFAGSVADLLAVRIRGAEVAQLQAAFRTQADRVAALDKAAALEQMAGGVAHDFRNLLTVVVGNAELLGETGVGGLAKELLADLLDAARRGMALAGELTAFARPEQRPAVLDLADVTARFVPVLQAAAGSGFRVHYSRPPTVGPCLIDKTQFTRVLLNLVVNARDATPGGGTVEVRLTPRAADRHDRVRELPDAGGRGPRHRDGRGDAAAGVRPVLHDQGRRHRAGAGGGAAGGGGPAGSCGSPARWARARRCRCSSRASRPGPAGRSRCPPCRRSRRGDGGSARAAVRGSAG